MTLLMLGLVLAIAPARGLSADWTLTDSERERVEAGAVIADGEMAADSTAAVVHAAVLVNAPPERVFRTLTDCGEVLHFVPHLKRCDVIDAAPDGRWQNVEQQVDYGWLVPRAHYVFRAEYEPFERIRFINLRGDFRENRGLWVFQPTDRGRATIVTYEAHIAPAFYVPRWMMRNTLRRDLPELMRGLRARAEAVRPAVATSAPPTPGP